MKKILAILLSVVLVLAMVPMVAMLATADTAKVDDVISKFVVATPGAVVDTTASTLEDGRVTFKVTLPAGGYVQFMQKVNLTADKDSTLKATVVPASLDRADYEAMRMYMQLTASDDMTKDIVPIKESDTNLPGNDGMTWRFYGASPTLWYGLGANTTKGYDANITTILNKGGNVSLTFTKTEGEKVLPIAPQVNGGALAELPSYKTLSDIGGANGVYFRLRSDIEETYIVTLESPDIKTPHILTVDGVFQDSILYVGNTVTLATPEVPVGYTFAGWNVLSGGVEIANNSFVMGTENVVVESVFEKIDYTITVDGEEYKVANYGDTVTLTVPEAAVGYTFAGWNVVSGGVEIANNSFVMGAENVVVESVFEKIDYIITVDGEEYKVANYGDAITLEDAEVPSDAKFVEFDKWVIVSGEGAKIDGNVLTIGAGNVEIKATYKAVAPYGDIRDLVRFDELGEDAPGVADSFADRYAQEGRVTIISIIAKLLRAK